MLYYCRLPPTDAVEASIINKILHCRQAEKQRITDEKDKQIQKLVEETNRITEAKNNEIDSLKYSNDALQLQLSS